MAERRMFAKAIVTSDAFLDMPLSARCLYFTLGMFADDDGFVGNPKAIMRQCGASKDDLLVLLQKRYILAFESGVIVIKHWRMNNYLQKDRYKHTTYVEELDRLMIDEKGAYTEKDRKIEASTPMYTECIQTVYTGKDSLGKDSLGKESKYISPEPKQVLPSEPPVITIPLNDGNEYSVTQRDIDEYKGLYPAVNVEQELRNMRGWCLANPSRRKTKKGVARFINGWLAKEQDKGKGTSGGFELKI